jgi:hypothetical protein
MNKKGGLLTGLIWLILILVLIWFVFFKTTEFFNIIESLKDICRASTRCMKIVGVIR